MKRAHAKASATQTSRVGTGVPTLLHCFIGIGTGEAKVGKNKTPRVRPQPGQFFASL